MPKHKLAFEAIGTTWSIETTSELSESLRLNILERIESFDSTYSRFRKNSLVSRVNAAAGTYEFPEDANVLFSFYEQLYRVTDGKVTMLIGEALKRAGYDADYSFASKPQKKLPRFDEVVKRQGSSMTFVEPVSIDVGAAGKGYLVDLVSAMLDETGVLEYVVDASGDMRHSGDSENIVGLEHPFDTQKVIGAIDVKNKSLCASAVNRRQWGDDMHHIFDPDTLTPTRDIAATWVIADSTMIADGLATALFFTDPAVLRKSFDYDFVRMHSDGTIDYSRAFEGKLFI